MRLEQIAQYFFFLLRYYSRYLFSKSNCFISHLAPCTYSFKMYSFKISFFFYIFINLILAVLLLKIVLMYTFILLLKLELSNYVHISQQHQIYYFIGINVSNMSSLASAAFTINVSSSASSVARLDIFFAISSKFLLN